MGDAGDQYTGYDRFGRTERMRWGKLGDGGSFTPLVDVKWGYSPSSQKTWRKDMLAPTATQQDQRFLYDGLQQVTERQRGVLNINHTAAGGVPAQQESFSYDETGNWVAYKKQENGRTEINQTRVNNRSNQVTQIDASSVGTNYDKNGNMLEVPTGDALTNPANKVIWDGWNRPVKVYDADDNLIAQYRYDGLGRRITVTSGGVTRHSYYDDQWRSIEERADDTATPERQHVWHPSDRWELLLRDRSTANNGVMDERLYPLKDQLDPVALADAFGNVVERYSYSAFGLPSFLNRDFTPKSGNISSFLWNFLFHAEFEDADTGWFNYGYRFYSPQLGRWLSRDPIGETGGENLYLFVENQSLIHQDFAGLAPNCTQEEIERIADADPLINKILKIMAARKAKGLPKCNKPKLICHCCPQVPGQPVPSGSQYNGVIEICSNAEPGKFSLADQLRHEHIHAYDDCDGADESKCDHYICKEIGAYVLQSRDKKTKGQIKEYSRDSVKTGSPACLPNFDAIFEKYYRSCSQRNF